MDSAPRRLSPPPTVRYLAQSNKQTMAARALESTDVPPIEALRAARKAQLAQIASLRSSVEAAATARDNAASEVRALEYVCDLTRDETSRRRCGNDRLARAYSGIDDSDTIFADADATEGVQKTETALLAAKTELSALRLSIDELHARARRARRAKKRAERAAALAQGTERLIADVDVVVLGNDVAAPGRVGVSPAGGLAILGYHSAEPVKRFGSSVLADGECVLPIAEEDEPKLRRLMKSAKVRTASAGDTRDAVPTATATIVGIADALYATMRLVNATSAATTIVDTPLPPPSPNSPRRPLWK